MAKIAELIEKHREYEIALREYEAIEARNKQIQLKDKEFSAKQSAVEDEIRRVRKDKASKIWGEMDQSRFTYGIVDDTKENNNPYYGPDYYDIKVSKAYISVMGLKLPVGGVESYSVVPVEDLLATGHFHPQYASEGLLKKFELDPVGTKAAVCESVRVRMMKDRAACPVEIRETEKELNELGKKLASLEKLVEEEIPDNAIMRRIFKKKFEAKEKAPAEILKVRAAMEDLLARKTNLEYRGELAEKLTTPEAIAEYVDAELEFLKAFIARDWAKEVDESSAELFEESKAISEERANNRNKTENSWEAKSKVDKLKKVLEADFDSMQKLFENKEFIEELRSFDTTGLSEDEKKMVEVIRDQYNQHLAKAVARYEDPR